MPHNEGDSKPHDTAKMREACYMYEKAFVKFWWPGHVGNIHSHIHYQRQDFSGFKVCFPLLVLVLAMAGKKRGKKKKKKKKRACHGWVVGHHNPHTWACDPACDRTLNTWRSGDDGWAVAERSLVRF
jgi:hypothetical protein